MEMSTKGILLDNATEGNPQLDNAYPPNAQQNQPPPAYSVQQNPPVAGQQPVQNQPTPGYIAQQNPPAAGQQPMQIVIVRQRAPLFPANNFAYMIKSHLLFSSICLAVGMVVTWPVSFCAIPAYRFSVLSRNKFLIGDNEAGTKYSRIALGCNIAATVTFFLDIILVIVLLAVFT